MREKPPPKPLALVGTPAEPGATAIPPPKTLGAAGRTLWRSIQAEFSITDSGGYAVLAVACEALDRADGLRKCIDEDGEVIALRSGPKVHPAIKEELACRAFVTRALGRLGVLDEPLKTVGRPLKWHGWDPFR
jgi:hypothetical protein